MKKFILAGLLIMVTASTFAQFTLTPKGLVNSKDSTQNYLVLNFDGKDKAALYNSVLSYVNKTYNSPKFVTDKVENTSINIKAESGLIASYKISTLNYAKMSFSYIVNIDFKDGKIKFEVIDFKYTNSGSSALGFKLVGKNSGMRWGIWDDSLTLKHEWLKIGTEKFFNDYVNDLNNAVKNQDNW